MSEAKRLPEVLAEYAAGQPARFHMPGHKGRGMNGFWRDELAQWDVTELAQTDNLHAPAGVIARAQEQWAAAVDAKHSFFLVNGSTCGILAMMLLCSGTVIIGRDCHRSALSGAALAGLDVEMLEIEQHPLAARKGVMEAQRLDAALERCNASAILVTSPNYYGMCADLPALAQVARRHGAKLLVDAAHGAHFSFSQALPPTPAATADMWVVSAHKTLNALGQAAVLCLGQDGPDPQRVQRILSLVQSSSPSYLLMASLDWARYTAQQGHCWDRQVLRAQENASRIERLPGIHVLGDELIGAGGVAAMDPTRICIDVRERGIDGYQAEASLAQQGVMVEMADAGGVVCITTPADLQEWYHRLFEGLRKLPYGRCALEEPAGPTNLHCTRAMPVREAVFGEEEWIPLAQAAGRILAQAAGPYPPGNAAVAPGERLSQEAVDYFLLLIAQDASVHGLRDGCLCCVRER